MECLASKCTLTVCEKAGRPHFNNMLTDVDVDVMRALAGKDQSTKCEELLYPQSMMKIPKRYSALLQKEWVNSAVIYSKIYDT